MGKSALQAERVIVAVLHELLKRERYATYADLKEDLKTACARLHLHADSGLISEALDQVEHGGRLSVLHRPREADSTPMDPAIGAAEARRITQAVEHRYGARVRAKAMPTSTNELVDVWHCVACGEPNQGNWTRCWQCGRAA
jgi:hypothetical protein